MDVSKEFWETTPEQMKNGYTESENGYQCLLCGEIIEKGIVYSKEGVFYEAGRFIKIHIEEEHQSVFHNLIKMDKKLTGLSDHQSQLLRLFYEGKSDKEVQEEMGIGSTSTIRNHRFTLKEKERQAKVFLALMELLKEKDTHAPSFISLPKTAKKVDDRYNITVNEREKILKKFFLKDSEGVLVKYPLKEKQRLVIISEIAKRFDKNQQYTEKEINQVLHDIYEDHNIIRRHLIEYGFMDRKADGSQYWLT